MKRRKQKSKPATPEQVRERVRAVDEITGEGALPPPSDWAQAQEHRVARAPRVGDDPKTSAAIEEVKRRVSR